MPGRRKKFFEIQPMRGGDTCFKAPYDSLLTPPYIEHRENVPEIRLPGGKYVKPVFLGSCTEQHRIRSSSL